MSFNAINQSLLNLVPICRKSDSVVTELFLLPDQILEIKRLSLQSRNNTGIESRITAIFLKPNIAPISESNVEK